MEMACYLIGYELESMNCMNCWLCMIFMMRNSWLVG